MKEIELLKEQISDLNNTIEILNKKLNESEALKGNFISNIMNEVYNPFSSIMFMAENISNLKKENLPKAPEMASTIFREAALLDFHLKNIFSAAKIEAGLESIEINSINLQEINNEILSANKILIQEKGIQLSVSEISDITIFSDREKISLIISNLLSNAIKNSPKSGKITLEYIVSESNLIICVCDQGKGIASQASDTIFDRFHRIDPTINSVTGGTGLGLSVVKSIIDILEGTIEFNKKINHTGTKVSITIPLCNKNEEDDDDDIFFDEEL